MKGTVSEIKKILTINTTVSKEQKLVSYLGDLNKIVKKYGAIIFGYLVLAFWILLAITSNTLLLESIINTSFIIASLLFLKYLNINN